jgi:hypothetical protein
LALVEGKQYTSDRERAPFGNARPTRLYCAQFLLGESRAQARADCRHRVHGSKGYCTDPCVSVVYPIPLAA